jgi:hypothetical protein
MSKSRHTEAQMIGDRNAINVPVHCGAAESIMSTIWPRVGQPRDGPNSGNVNQIAF